MSRTPAEERPFRRVANELRDKILRGELAPGDKIPSESKLGALFGVSRVTARKGIAILKGEGLVTSHQGKGAFVRERPQVSLLSTGTNYRERRATGVANYNAEAATQGQVARQLIREVGEAAAPADVADYLEVEAGAAVAVRRRLFVIDDKPMQLVDSYYPADLAAGTKLLAAKPIRGGAHAVIEDPDGPIRRRIVQFVEDLDVRMPTPVEMESLEIPAGVPVARVIRTAYDSSGAPVEVNDSIVPCDRHKFRYVIDVP